jgi:hypothetical protein
MKARVAASADPGAKARALLDIDMITTDEYDEIVREVVASGGGGAAASKP